MVAAVDSIVAIPRLWSAGVIVVAQGLSCSMVCGIFLGQGSNPCLLHWQADFFFFFLPLSTRQAPGMFLIGLQETLVFTRAAVLT